MKNLLNETLEILKNMGKKQKDILKIGTKDFYIPLNAWKRVLNIEYDSGYGTAEIDKTLTIIFKDGSWLERVEYDGLEWWEIKKTPVVGKSKFKETSLARIVLGF